MYLLRNFAKAALSWSAIAGIHRTVKWSDAKMKDCMLSMYSASEPVGARVIAHKPLPAP